jgi:phospholipase/carboxylesterase/glyoxalase family protein
MNDTSDPHRGKPVLTAGPGIAEARAAMIMLHGRGASANDIIGIAQVIDRPDIACLAPEAAGFSWYPRPFMEPIENNQPHLASALLMIAGLIARCNAAGLPPNRVALLGFSQGACLSLEFAARSPRRYAGIFTLSGGLVGGSIGPENYSGSLDGTPVFLGCSDDDPYIPLIRVQESTAVMAALGADTNERIYAGMGHVINEDEIGHVQGVLDAIPAR